MRPTLAELKAELAPMLKLAWPLVLAELGWMSMSVVDTVMVGRVGATAMGAVSLGSVLYFTVAMLGAGLLLGLDALIPHAFGEGKLDECHRWLIQGVWIALLLTPPLMGFVWLAAPALRALGTHPDVLRDTLPYIGALNWSTLPLLLYFACRRYLQSLNLVKPVSFALVSANLVNVAVNWILIYGHFGAPAMGAEGAGWATCISRAYMTLVLAAAIAYYNRRRNMGLARVPWALEWERIRRIATLGLPVSLQITVEIGVFALATALAARLDPASLAGHQVAMNVVSVTYMVPLGISAAAAVRVGQALGRRDARHASLAGWTAIGLGASFMACSALTMWLVPHWIVRAYTPDPAVLRMGAAIVFVSGFFQLFDGIQVVATGALRGAGDTRTAMLTHLAGYWAFGLPIGALMCFGLGWGVPGLWVGLSAGLIAIGVVLLTAWIRKVRRLGESEFTTKTQRHEEVVHH